MFNIVMISSQVFRHVSTHTKVKDKPEKNICQCAAGKLPLFKRIFNSKQTQVESAKYLIQARNHHKYLGMYLHILWNKTNMSKTYQCSAGKLPLFKKIFHSKQKQVESAKY